MGGSGGNTRTGGKPPFQSLVPIAEDLDRPREFEKSAHPDKSDTKEICGMRRSVYSYIAEPMVRCMRKPMHENSRFFQEEKSLRATYARTERKCW